MLSVHTETLIQNLTYKVTHPIWLKQYQWPPCSCQGPTIPWTVFQREGPTSATCKIVAAQGCAGGGANVCHSE